jgi:hyperosmotically inducible periplasmic protein
MKTISAVTLATLAALALGGCDRPGTKTATITAPNAVTTTTVSNTASTAPTTADTTTPNTPAVTASTTKEVKSATSSTAETGPASANVVTDTIVTGKVKAAIATDNAMKDADISVKTENGVVTLTGSVKSPDQVTLAAALAQRQEGVSRVENQVAVR